jgi:hypothetical protein
MASFLIRLGVVAQPFWRQNEPAESRGWSSEIRALLTLQALGEIHRHSGAARQYGSDLHCDRGATAGSLPFFHREPAMSEYKVGYGKPPKSGQFKRGKSGNPRGRPKGSQKLATDLAAELNEQITVREDGKSRRVSKQRALIKSLMAKALQGDVRANAAVLALYARVITDLPGDEDKFVEEDELQILRQFAPKLLQAAAPAKKRKSK